MKTTFDPKSILTDSESPESDTFGLRFDSHDDALNYVNKLVQDGKDFLAIKKLNFVEHYKVGRLALNIEFLSGRDSGHYKLVFVAVPAGWIPDVETNSEPFHTNDFIAGRYRPKDAVLISTSKAIQCPKEIVPSFVWLTPFYDVPNLLRELSTTTVKSVIEVGFGLSDGEIGRVRGQGTQVSNRTDSLIQSITEVDSGVAGVAPQGPWYGFEKFDLQQLVSAVDAWLSDSGVCVTVLQELLNFPVEFGNVILSPCDAEL